VGTIRQEKVREFVVDVLDGRSMIGYHQPNRFEFRFCGTNESHADQQLRPT